MNIILFLIYIIPVISIYNINFYELAIKDKECLDYYNINVKSTYIKHKQVQFYQYLEYWWNIDENDDELLNRVCNFIYDKYNKRYIRVPNNDDK